MVKWAGRLIVFFGTAHTLGAFTALGAANHAEAWFSRELWLEDLSNMSPAMSAYWLSVNSFGPTLILVGLIVLWLNRREIMPPSFIAWWLIIWTVVDLILAGPGLGQGVIILVASGLLLAAARRVKHSDSPCRTAFRRPTCWPVDRGALQPSSRAVNDRHEFPPPPPMKLARL